MPVPNEVIFGVDDSNESITYGDIRNINDDTELIKLLKYRLNVYLINQVEPIGGAFPKANMTCILIETLGDIFYGEGETQSFGFISVCKRLHKGFSDPMGKKFKKALVIYGMVLKMFLK